MSTSISALPSASSVVRLLTMKVLVMGICGYASLFICFYGAKI
ncbi:hypothetical protein HMPREF9446_03704 [Bacteroides fluxus YIT 12057]|uniref:Uncharacterized protein n=1 Tax=Bacteroides fluxus YIT 12057 TaxID=763034 RepID=F3PY56_9BACE|nr:hypothetical protein HMPREF9446_03704 [Bacteroides fluxus YIT 12057]